LPGLFVAAAFSGWLTAAFELARSAWVAQQVPVGELPRRNAQLSAVGSVSEAASFAIGGWLFQGLGAAVALAIDGASYALSALCLRGVPEVPGAAAPQAASGSRLQRLRAEALQGLHAVFDRPVLRTLAGVEGLLAFWMGLGGTSYMIFVSRDVGLPTGTLGMVFALGGLGSVAGAALAPRLGRRWGPGRVMTLGLLLAAVGAACLPLVPGPGWIAVALLVSQQTVGDAGHTLQQVHDRTLRQTAVPADRLACADAGIRTVGYIGTVAGAGVGGVLGTLFDARTVLALAAACVAAAALLAALRLAERRS
jgi:hypothetical protein